MDGIGGDCAILRSTHPGRQLSTVEVRTVGFSHEPGWRLAGGEKRWREPDLFFGTDKLFCRLLRACGL